MVGNDTIEFRTDYCRASTSSSSGWDYYPTSTSATCTTYKSGWDTIYEWYEADNSTSNTIISKIDYEMGTYGEPIIKKTMKIAYDHWLDASRFYYKWKEGEAFRVPPLSPQDRLKEIIQSRHAPAIIVRRDPMKRTQDVKEMRARETLRRILGEDKFQSFIKNGFVTVRARSGLTYQIFPGHGITAVYRDGQMVERLCVVLRGSFPPTDSLIMRYLLILNDEQDFRSHAISHSVRPLFKSQETRTEQQEPLTEIFRKLKVA